LDSKLRFAIASFLAFGLKKGTIKEFLNLEDSKLIDAFFEHQRICQLCQELKKEEWTGREIAHKLTRFEIQTTLLKVEKKRAIVEELRGE